MRLNNYREDLLKRLRDPQYATDYLAQVLAEHDSAAILIALKDVVEAGGDSGFRISSNEKTDKNDF